MFPKIDSFSTLGIGLYLFYKKKVIAQFKTREKNDRSPYSFMKRGGFTSLASARHKKNPPMFQCVCVLITNEIMRSKDAECKTGQLIPKI